MRRNTKLPIEAESDGLRLSVQGLAVSHGAAAVLRDISFKVNVGEILVVLGKSGIGKTTLLDAISGLSVTEGGRVCLNGRLAYVMQKDLLLSWRTSLKNVLLPIEIMGGDIASAEADAKRLLDQEGLGHVADMYPKELSGGMRQKVSFIRMLAADPDIALLDEPFSALDYGARLRHVKGLRDWAVQNRKAVVYVTHDMEEAIGLGDRLLVLGGAPGRIVLETRVDLPEVQRDPATLRQTKVFQDTFSLLWRTLKA